MATAATGSICQTSLVERRHLDQVGQFDSLNQKLRDPVCAVYDDGLGRVEIDQ